MIYIYICNLFQVENYLKLLTFLPIDDIEGIMEKHKVRLHTHTHTHTHTLERGKKKSKEFVKKESVCE